jgi:hypothetical protein
VLDQFKRAAADRTGAGVGAAIRRVELPTMERILIHALFTSIRVRRELLPEMAPELVAGLVSHEIIEAFRHVTSEEPARVFAEVEARLSESGRTLLHEALAADHTEVEDEELAWNQATACLDRLRGDHRKRLVADLKAKVKIAEREGRVDEALALMSEINGLLDLDRAERDQKRRAS